MKSCSQLLNPSISLMVKGKSKKNTRPRMGFAACSFSGCPCQAYLGSGSNCQNCGHQYEMHW
jgi:hypothetical protein